MLLILDNYDSFVFNLARYFERLGQRTHVVRNDQIDVAGIKALHPSAVVISPGPCGPAEAGCAIDVVQELYRDLPILGICLGHQVIGAALGATVTRTAPVHGQSWQVYHEGRGMFTGLPNPLAAGRYHSLHVDEATLTLELEVTARTSEGVVMAIEHRTAPLVGFQFHPESILTSHGYALLAAFLRRAGLPTPSHLPDMQSELTRPSVIERPLPEGPVTF